MADMAKHWRPFKNNFYLKYIERYIARTSFFISFTVISVLKRLEKSDFLKVGQHPLYIWK